MARFENFGELKSAVAYHLGANSVADLGTAREAHLERIINNAVRHIHEQQQHRHLLKRVIRPALAKVTVTTGINVANGATTADFTGGEPDSTWIGATVLFEDSETPYRVVSISGTTVTLSSSYAGATVSGATGSAVAIWSHILLPEDYDVLVACQQLTNNDRIDYVDYALLLKKVGNPYAVSWSRPRWCAIDGRLEDSDGDMPSGYTYRPWSLFLYPCPEDRIDVQVDYTRMVNEMTAAADEPDLPPQDRQLIFELACAWFSDPEASKDFAKLSMDAVGRKPLASPRKVQFGSAWRGGRGWPEERITVDNTTIWPGGINP